MPVPFLPPGNDLSNRDLAIVLWLGVFVVLVLARGLQDRGGANDQSLHQGRLAAHGSRV